MIEIANPPAPRSVLVAAILPALALLGDGVAAPTPQPKLPLFAPPLSIVRPAAERDGPVWLGIDVLAANNFTAIRGKRLGLLTHPAGVNREGTSTIDVLRAASGPKLVALFAPEHGIYGNAPASAAVARIVDPRTGLPVHSLYGRHRRPTKAMLKGIDAMVIDLQDVGTRSYTFVSVMRWTMEGCFENNVEVIVLDRPNPLGGLKVDGPPLDAQWAKDNYVGAFRVPYVHGLTIGELARMAKEAPGVLDLPDDVRSRGRLTVVPMRGWVRAMRWSETGLVWIPTSPFVPDFAAVQGYPMVGLGTYVDSKANFDLGFRHGIGPAHPFRGLSHKTTRLAQLERELQALRRPGLRFQRVSALDRAGRTAVGLYVEISDYDDWRPAELNFYLMKLACKLSPANPFARAPGRDVTGFLRHLGSTAFYQDIANRGANVDVDAWMRTWRQQALIYQKQSRRYWLYH